MADYNQEKYVDIALVDKLKKIRSSRVEGYSKSLLNEMIKKEERSSFERLMIELFESCLWRDDQVELLRVLGTSGDKRAVEFLINFIETSSDLTLASEAVLSLSESNSPMAAEFLVNLLKEKNNPFHKEALIVLGKSSLFSFEKELIRVIQDPDSSRSLKVFALISCGYKLKKYHFDFILESLKINYEGNAALFNSTLLAAGKVGTKSDLEKILSFDTRFRFFANELKEYAVHRIIVRSNLSKDSVIESLIKESSTSLDFKRSLLLLKDLDRKDILTSFLRLNKKKDPEKEALLRLSMIEQKTIQDDHKFFLSHVKEVTDKTLAYFIRFCHVNEQKKVIQELFDKLDFKTSLVVLSYTTWEKVCEFLIKKYNLKNTTTKIKIEIINVMTYQFLMKNLSKTDLDSLVSFLFDIVKREKDPVLTGRALRALCQIRKTPVTKINEIDGFFQKGQVELGSFLYFLKNCKNKESQKILLREFEIALENNNFETMRFVLDSLSYLMGPFKLDPSKMSDKVREHCNIPLLKVLAHHKLLGFDSFIEQGLKSKFHDHVLLAIKAFRINQRPSTWKLICDFTSSKVEPIRRWAQDTLCLSGGFEQHKFIFDKLIHKKTSKEELLYFFKNIKPQNNPQYDDLAKKLEDLILSNVKPMDNKELVSAAIGLKDRMSISQALKKDHALAAPKKHALDETISLMVPGYQNFSNIIKSVLRNAELTWERKDLFDALVDKSTMVIQYTKSIEILIQEKIGQNFFLRPASLLRSLQTRLVLLKLDDPYLSSLDVINNLQCGSCFSRDNFPRSKFSMLVRSILSGKFVHDQYRVLDGLRAWSLMFLIFFRDFNFQNKKIISFIKLSDSSDRNITQLSYSLNHLQEIRNMAAHRGTLFNLEKIADVRKESFDMIKNLNVLLKS